MNIRIHDFDRVYEALGDDAIESALAKRNDNGMNAIWFSHGDRKYPALVILVNGELATIHYFPKNKHPGFRSVGHLRTLEPGGTTVFFINSVNEPEQVLNDSVVSLATALKAAKEFAASSQLPPSVEWLEL